MLHRFQDRFLERHSFLGLSINKVDQYDRVIDHDTGQGHDTAKAEKRQRQSQDGVSPDRSNQSKRNDQEDNKGLEIGFKLDRQDHENRQQGHDKSDEQALSLIHL